MSSIQIDILLNLCLFLQQWRLLPFLAAAYVLTQFNRVFRKEFVAMILNQRSKTDSDRLVRIFFSSVLGFIISLFTKTGSCRRRDSRHVVLCQAVGGLDGS